MNNRILLILPFFGQLPNYFDLWLESVRNNPEVDFLLVTDNHADYSFPSNIRLVYTSFDELSRKIQALFDFRISLDNPYKLCDFKPAYGMFFSDFLKDYDFWGHCDCDLVFGNIRKFVTDDILDCFDRIFEYGHLCIYRNVPDVNQSFMERVSGVREYKTVFSSKIVQCFDEMCGMTPIWNAIWPSRSYREKPFDDIDFSKFKLNIIGENSKYTNIYQYKNGALIRYSLTGQDVSSKEVCYIHLQKRRMDVADMLDKSDFMIIPNKFVAPMELSPAIFRTLSRGHIYLYPLRIKFKSVLRKVKFRYENLLCHGTLK